MLRVRSAFPENGLVMTRRSHLRRARFLCRWKKSPALILCRLCPTSRVVTSPLRTATCDQFLHQPLMPRSALGWVQPSPRGIFFARAPTAPLCLPRLVAQDESRRSTLKSALYDYSTESRLRGLSFLRWPLISAPVHETSSEADGTNEVLVLSFLLYCMFAMRAKVPMLWLEPADGSFGCLFSCMESLELWVIR